MPGEEVEPDTILQPVVEASEEPDVPVNTHTGVNRIEGEGTAATGIGGEDAHLDNDSGWLADLKFAPASTSASGTKPDR
ncbi:hypothetical protein [Maritimibacter dapengensis]|uniref:Uncharacterized protein n=1 Tax=Maritimibacter dapengensis TaxID=2836868 RepID=A0ABS6SX18_9RHOB|nr:hypothetical protein [Maritimibacter dapengensis]MBV7377500.1 hypothetical protein [Maritimibacter dapengensis]